MYCCVLRVELFIPSSHSLKQKRGVIRPILEGVRNRFSVSVAETGFQDLWQRCEFAIAVVGSSAGHVDQTLDACERFVWSFPEVEVTLVDRRWLD